MVVVVNVSVSTRPSTGALWVGIAESEECMTVFTVNDRVVLGSDAENERNGCWVPARRIVFIAEQELVLPDGADVPFLAPWRQHPYKNKVYLVETQERLGHLVHGYFASEELAIR